MSKVVRLTEKDLTNLVNKIVNEQQLSSAIHGAPNDHPMENPFLKQMLSHIDGENVQTIKYIPNKMLVIDAFGNKYTITKS